MLVPQLGRVASMQHASMDTEGLEAANMVGVRRTSARHRVAGSHGAHRDLAGCPAGSGRPVESRRRRSRRPGGHGGEQRAVFAYQIESYRYWQEQLKRTDFVHGQFGENFTIEGLPDDAILY
jgi:MOSC domain-containing protein YiiM